MDAAELAAGVEFPLVFPRSSDNPLDRLRFFGGVTVGNVSHRVYTGLNLTTLIFGQRYENFPVHALAGAVWFKWNPSVFVAFVTSATWILSSLK